MSHGGEEAMSVFISNSMNEALPVRSRIRQVLNVAATYICCCFASGVLIAYPTLASLFVDHGVFNESCNANEPIGTCTSQNDKLAVLYYVSIGLMSLCYVLIGQAFDSFGSRTVAVVGALGASLCFGLTSLAICEKKLEWLLWISIPLADTFGYLNSFALVGFLYHFPKHQVLLIGIINSSYNASSAMLYLLSFMTTKLHLPFFAGLLVLAGCALLSAMLSSCVVPSQQEYLLAALRADVPIPKRIPPFRPWRSFSNALRVVRKYSLDNAVFFVGNLLSTTYIYYWTGGIFQFLSVSVGATMAGELSVRFAIVYAVVGTLVTPLTGLLYDFVGMKLFAWFVFLQLAIVFGFGTGWLSSEWAFTMSFVGANVFLTSSSNLVLKWIAIYAPAELYGSVFGAMFTLMGLFQLAVNVSTPALLSAASARFDSASSVYVYAFVALGSVGLLSWMLFAAFVCCRTLPSTPPQLDGDEKVLIQNVDNDAER